MTPLQFRQRIAATAMSTASPTARALRRVLVDGLSAYAAAREAHIDPAAISRARAIIERATPSDRCPKCGNRVN